MPGRCGPGVSHPSAHPRPIMQTLLALSLAAMAALLFYRFVERRHKLLLAKVGAVLLALVGLGLGAIHYSNSRDNRRWTQRRNRIAISVLRDSMTDPLEKIIGRRDTTALLQLRICNQADLPIEHLSLTVATYVEGRSTAHEALLSQRSSYSYPPPQIETDYIIPSGSCKTLLWQGRFFLADSVAAKVYSARFAGER